MPFISGGGASGGAAAGAVLDYAQVTAGLTVTATTDATADTFITGNPVAYDGATVILVQFYTSLAQIAIATAQNIVMNLYDGATDLGRIGNIQTVGNANAAGGTVYGARRLTPSAATHTYSIRSWKTTGGATASLAALAGGVATTMPAFLLITKIG